MQWYKRLAFTALFLSLIAMTATELFAVGEEAPIIALTSNNLYAVSPTTGEARLLVERQDDLDDALRVSGLVNGLQLGPISPDNTHVAYTVPLYEVLDPAYDSKRRDITHINPNDVVIVEIATGKLTPITAQGANLADAVEQDALVAHKEVMWSVDGDRLYFVANQLSLRNRVPQATIEIYDVETGETRILAKPGPQASIIGLYPVTEGVIVVDGAQNQSSFTFTLYNDDGQIVSVVEQELLEALDCTNGRMFSLNPVVEQDDYHYAYYDFPAGQAIPTLLNVATGESIPLEADQFPAFVSHTHPETSLRVVHANMCGDGDTNPWIVTDTDGFEINAMSLGGIDRLAELGVSPDGQSVAHLKAAKPGDYSATAIMIMDANGIRELDFKAHQIIWGAIDFTFAPMQFRG